MSNTVQDKLSSARLKVERAKEHIADLNLEWRTFFDSKPYDIRPERDPQTRQLIYHLKRIDPIPDRISLIAGEAIQDLRVALDYLAYQLFLAGFWGPSTRPRDVSFPIGDETKEIKTKGYRKVKGMSQDVIDAIGEIEPDEGGKGHQLWVLNELNNISKHRLLVAVACACHSPDFGAIAARSASKLLPEGMPLAFSPIFLKVKPAVPAKAGDKLFTDAPDAEPHQNLKFAFEVTFNESGVLEGEPLAETLHQLSQLVGDVLTQFAPLL